LLIEAREIRKRAGGAAILDGASLSVVRGETVAVVGPSGAGKSTLLRCLNGLVPFDSGAVLVDGLELSPELHPAERTRRVLAVRRRLGMVFQEFNLFPHLTALENAALGPREVLGLSAREAEERAARYLERVHLGDKLHARPAELSGGQRQRVAIARALAMEPAALLLDEPTSALDPALKAEVAAVIGELRADGLTMVIVTHEYELARRTAGRVVEMAAGRTVRSGTPAEILGG